MFDAMRALRHFCNKHNIKTPEAVVLRFDTQDDAASFLDAITADAGPMVKDTIRLRTGMDAEIMGIPLLLTWQRGSYYAWKTSIG